MVNTSKLHEAHKDELCESCWALRCAMDVFEAAIWNALAAGVDPDTIVEVVHATLHEANDPEKLTAGTETAGAA